MKQATGATNNRPDTQNVSIRLRLDGHAFSMKKLVSSVRNEQFVEISVLAAKTMLVPGELFSEHLSENLMRINGMAPSASETVLHTDPTQAVVALMAADRNSVEEIRRKFGNRVHWSSPLLRPSDRPTTSHFRIFRDNELAFVQIWGPKLRMAEVFTAPAAEDLLYYVTELSRETQLENVPVLIGGSPITRDTHLLREYFKSVIVCE